LRKKPLSIVPSVYTNSENAIAALQMPRAPSLRLFAGEWVGNPRTPHFPTAAFFSAARRASSTALAARRSRASTVS
jgi:hypothetical protein